MLLGLIGAGRIGAYHAGILKSLDGVDDLLVFDAVADRAESVAHEIGATPSDLDRLFEVADAVVIASSTDTHAEMLERAAGVGKPAFCEKPIDLDLAATRRAVEAVEAAGIAVQMGFQRRYDPAIRSIRRRIADGELGELFLVRSQTHDPAPPPLEYIPRSGGIFRDCLIHDIDAVRYVTGQEVVRVAAAGSALGHPAIAELGDVGSAAATLEMSSGTIAQISGLRLDPVGYDVRLEVFAEKDSVAAGWSDRTPIRSAESGTSAPADPITTFWDRFAAAYRAEMEGFLRVMRGDEKPASTPRDAYENLRVAAACDLSLGERRMVELEEIE